MSFAPANVALVASIVARAEHPTAIDREKLLIDMLRNDVGHLITPLADLRVPVMALQTTYSNEKCERRPIRTEIIEDIGHLPQIDEVARTDAPIEIFLDTVPAS